jgi:hypothetical protein
MPKQQTAPSATVLALLQDNAGDAFSPAEIADQTGLSKSQVSPALQHLQTRYPRQVVNSARGAWEWVDDESEGIETEGHRPRVAQRFSKVSEQGRGVWLVDEQGNLWYAIPATPPTVEPAGPQSMP